VAAEKFAAGLSPAMLFSSRSGEAIVDRANETAHCSEPCARAVQLALEAAAKRRIRGLFSFEVQEILRPAYLQLEIGHVRQNLVRRRV